MVMVFNSLSSCHDHVHTIVHVTGAKEDDYIVDDELNKVIVEESSSRDAKDAKDATESTNDQVSDASVKTTMGSISFVSCATGEDAMQTLAAGDSEEGRFREYLFLASLVYFFSSFFVLKFQKVNQG